jgi:hypothetical protein
MDNVQKVNDSIKIPSSQTFRAGLLGLNYTQRGRKSAFFFCVVSYFV